MTRASLILGIFYMFLANSLYGQNYTFSGYIEDGSTGEKLIAATVYDQLSEKGTSSK